MQTIKKPFVIIALALVAFVLYWGMQSETPTIEAETTTDDPVLAEITETARARHKVYGVNVAIITPDGKEHTASAGLENRFKQDPLTADKVMLAGSTGKVLFSAVALMLVDEGVLDLDAPISKWIADEAWFSRLPNGDDITIRMLMNHSSGLINHVEHEDFLADFKVLMAENPDNSVSTVESLAYLLDKEPLFEAGSAMAYSDTNYILMAYIVEKITGRSFYDLIEERILKPQGFKNIYAQRSRDIPNLATGHLTRGTNLFGLDSDTNMNEDGELLFNPSFEYGGGGYAATAVELARLAKKLYVERLVTDTQFGEMSKTLTLAEGPGFRIGYGLGFMTYQTPFGFAVGHSGYMPGYRSEMFYFEEDKVIVAITANQSQGFNATMMAFTIADEYMKALGIRETTPAPAEDASEASD